MDLRRYCVYLEHAIDRGTQWVVFEPNGERLWANVAGRSRTPSTRQRSYGLSHRSGPSVVWPDSSLAARGQVSAFLKEQSPSARPSLRPLFVQSVSADSEVM